MTLSPTTEAFLAALALQHARTALQRAELRLQRSREQQPHLEVCVEEARARVRELEAA